MNIDKGQIFAIPNILSYFRIILMPIFCVIYLSANSEIDYLISAGVVVISGLTDLFDGKIARRFNAVTELGKFVDPVADKLTLVTIAFCLIARVPAVIFLAGALLFKEVFMAIMATIHMRRNQKLSGALMVSKVCTTTLFLTFIILIVAPGLPLSFVRLLVTVESVLVLMTVWYYYKAFEDLDKQ